jgi:hypothetical protein
MIGGSDRGPEDRQAARLHELAAKRATGALHLSGRAKAVVYVVQGRVDHVESSLVPGLEALLLRPRYPEETWQRLVLALRRGGGGGAGDVAASAADLVAAGEVPPLHLEVLRRGALADAALTFLTGPDAFRGRARFRPGERHWCPGARTLAVEEVLAESTRRRAVLARLTRGVGADVPVRRSPRLWFERVRLTATQWDVVRLADGRRTPVDIAWQLGHGAFATTVAVHQLARLGVVAVEGYESRPTSAALPARDVLPFLRAATGTALAVPVA